ncbi:MAG: hypothetical protein HC902_08335 [Calothrix sp. SM1_5_4]|nr:hypothetical protein [Calothrix sp. SM1_5_4]
MSSFALARGSRISLILFLFATSFCVFALQSGDALMYLALARDFVLNGDWSSRDPYLYSLPNAELVWQHEYLSYLIFYAVHAVFGFPGLILLKTVLWGAVFLTVLRAEPRQRNESWLWIGLWVLAVLAGSFRFIERASLFSDLFCVLLVSWLLPRSRIDRGLLLRISLLFLLWIQVHPGFPLGWALVGLWTLWHLIHTPSFRDYKRLAWLSLPLALMFLNPLGWEGIVYPIRFALNEARTLKEFNFEWLPSYHPLFRFAPETLAFWALSGFASMIVIRERAWMDLRTWFALFAFVAATQSVRFVPWASFVMITAIKPWCELRGRRHFGVKLEYAALALILALSLKNFTTGYKSSSGQRLAHLGLDPKFFPETTTEFLRQRPIPGRLYNTHDFGSYLIWRKMTPIFHHGFVTDMRFYREEVAGVFQSQERFLELVRRHGWTMLLVEKHGAYRYFHRILSPLPDWKIVAEDESSYLIYYLPDSNNGRDESPQNSRSGQQ